MTKTPTALDLSQLLAARHADDLWVPECKDGPTQTDARMVQMDGWAMKRSWARPCYYGYEIKVSRSDFQRDEKWHRYLPLCNRFSFVCPRGLIEKDELPADVGLIWATKAGNKLVTKRAAHHREIETPVQLFTYILMCRTRIKMGNEPDEGQAIYWRKWLETRDEHRHLGTHVSAELSRRYREIEGKLVEAQRAAERYEPVREWLERHGIRHGDYSRPIRDLARFGPFIEPDNTVAVRALERSMRDAQDYVTVGREFLDRIGEIR